ncbi:MAG: hypothetical protein AAF203_05850 [Pseudomonadota bacterium]
MCLHHFLSLSQKLIFKGLLKIHRFSSLSFGVACLFVVSLGFSQSSQARSCTETFVAKNRDVLEVLKSAIDDGLTPEAEAALVQHKIYRWARSFPDGGREFHFKFYIGLDGKFQIKADKGKGEAIQAQAVKRYLEFLFPNATFGVSDHKAAYKTNISFWLDDIAEGAKPGKDIRPEEILEMGILKSGNPGLTVESGTSLRKKLGIPKSKRILHMYVQNEKMGYKRLKPIIESVVGSYQFDTLIISFGNLIEAGPPLSRIESLARAGDFASFFRSMGELKGKSAIDLASDNEPKLVFNNTRGLMLPLYSLSDLAFVVGPIDFFQPITVGIPTVLMLEPETMDYSGYDEVRAKELTDIASQSPGFTEIKTVEEIPAALQQVLSDGTPVNPAFLEISGNSPFQQMLDHLMVRISEQLGNQ